MNKKNFKSFAIFFAGAVVGAFVLFLFFGTMSASPIIDNSTAYSVPAEVTEVNWRNGWVAFTDWGGEVWCIRDDDYELGQLVILDFEDNGTPDNIYDDPIVQVHRLVDIKGINE